ncbi:hypothetical protein KEJ39_03305 [Candidatus Bathyarchaeota archaeon]|nr:hypothetical protein [Candidatus Bathyarchaeota archaeon]
MARLDYLWNLYLAGSMLLMFALMISGEYKRRLISREYAQVTDSQLEYSFTESNELTTDLEGTPISIDLIRLRHRRMVWEKVSNILYAVLITSSGSVLMLVQFEVLSAPWWVSLSSVLIIFASAYLMRRTWKILKAS